MWKVAIAYKNDQHICRARGRDSRQIKIQQFEWSSELEHHLENDESQGEHKELRKPDRDERHSLYAAGLWL